jgi:hypothetical protein
MLGGELGELNFWEGIPDHPLHQRFWAPLPAGRRPRQLERARRVRLVREWRAVALAVLVQRIRQLAPPLRPCPPHGRVCPPGCAECAAIMRWRVEYSVIAGFDRGESGYLFP